MKFVYCTVTIGNSDDKLTQKQWSKFLADITFLVQEVAEEVWFTGYSTPVAPWQNMLTSFQMNVQRVPYVSKQLSILARKYKQDYIAFVASPVGNTIIVKP